MKTSCKPMEDSVADVPGVSDDTDGKISIKTLEDLYRRYDTTVSKIGLARYPFIARDRMVEIDCLEDMVERLNNADILLKNVPAYNQIGESVESFGKVNGVRFLFSFAFKKMEDRTFIMIRPQMGFNDLHFACFKSRKNQEKTGFQFVIIKSTLQKDWSDTCHYIDGLTDATMIIGAKIYFYAFWKTYKTGGSFSLYEGFKASPLRAYTICVMPNILLETHCDNGGKPAKDAEIEWWITTPTGVRCGTGVNTLGGYEGVISLRTSLMKT